jgi:hypothetical protein
MARAAAYVGNESERADRDLGDHRREGQPDHEPGAAE